MKFGLSFLPDANPATKSAEQYYADAIALSKYADINGLSTIKMTEHYLHSYGGYCPNPLLFLSAVAVQTKQIRLMTGCILPAFHHPIQIAAHTAMLDVLSQGRLDIGFARAYLPYEFDAFEVSLDESRARYEQTIEAVIRLWKEKDVSVESPYFRFKNVNSFPDTLQIPHPPVWGAAVRSNESFAWIGEQEFNLLVTPPIGLLSDLAQRLKIYRESYLASRSDKTKQPKIALSMPLCIAKNNQEAEQVGDYYLQRYLDVWADAAECWNRRNSTDYPGYSNLASVLRNAKPQTMRFNTSAIFAEPERVLEEINRIKSLLYVDEILWQIDFGAQPIETSMNTLQLFIEEVMPHC